MQTMTKMMKSDAVLLSLTKEEAVVLADWLYQNSGLQKNSCNNPILSFL